MSKEKKVENVNEKAEVKTLSKNQVIGLVIVFISLLIIVYIAFIGMSNRPIEEMSKEEAFDVLNEIYGSSWVLDEYGDLPNLSRRERLYKKIWITSDFDKDNLRIPTFLYLDKNQEIIGRELSLIYFENSTNLLKIQMPDAKVYDFVYAKSLSGKMENLAIIDSNNERIYYIKESLTD